MTPELTEAYEDLDKALRKVLILEENKNSGNKGSFMLTDYLIISAVQGVDDDGDTCTGITYTMPPGINMPWYRVMGLVSFTMARLSRMAAPDMPWGRS